MVRIQFPVTVLQRKTYCWAKLVELQLSYVSQNVAGTIIKLTRDGAYESPYRIIL